MSGTPELDAELAALNKAVDDAIAARVDWMDAHMADYAKWPIGTELFDLSTSERLGVVSEFYRYHARQNSLFDRSMSIDYQYRKSEAMNIYDNTSRQPYRRIGSKEELILEREGEVKRLKAESGV